MRTSIATILALFAIAAAGCGKGSEGGCPPLEVTIDGEAVTLGHVLAVADATGLTVTAFDGDDVTCEQLLASQRTTRPDEIAVRAYVAKSGGLQAVGIGGWTKMGVDAQLVSEPKAEGDTASICVPTKVEFTPQVGAAKDKTVTVHGLFSGPFCGTRD